MDSLVDVQFVPILVGQSSGKETCSSIWVAHFRDGRVSSNCHLVVSGEVFCHEIIIESRASLTHSLERKCKVLQSQQSTCYQNEAKSFRAKSQGLYHRGVCHCFISFYFKIYYLFATVKS